MNDQTHCGLDVLRFLAVLFGFCVACSCNRTKPDTTFTTTQAQNLESNYLIGSAVETNGMENPPPLSGSDRSPNGTAPSTKAIGADAGSLTMDEKIIQFVRGWYATNPVTRDFYATNGFPIPANISILVRSPSNWIVNVVHGYTDVQHLVDTNAMRIIRTK